MTGHRSKRASDSRFGDMVWSKPAVIELLESRRLMDALPSLGDFLESAPSPWDGLAVAGIAEASSMPACAVQDDGRIVVAVRGDTYVGGELLEFHTVVFRLNADLSLDTSFGVDGRISLPTLAGLNVVAIEDDGQILVAGAATTTPRDNGGDIAIVRLNSDGTIDTTFGTDGMAVLPDTNQANDDIVSMAVLANGQIMVVGNANYRWLTIPDGWDAWYNSDRSDVMVYRLNADGQLDTTYNGSGWVQIDYQPGDLGGGDWADAKIAADGSVVLNVYSQMGAWDVMTDARHLARVAPDGSRDAQFEQYAAEVMAGTGPFLEISFVPATDGTVFVLAQDYSVGPKLWRIDDSGAEVLPFEYAGPGDAGFVHVLNMSMDDAGQIVIAYYRNGPVATQWIGADGQTLDTAWYEQEGSYPTYSIWYNIESYFGVPGIVQPDGSLVTMKRTDFGRYLQYWQSGGDGNQSGLMQIWVRRWDVVEQPEAPVVEDPLTPTDPPTIPDPVIPEPPVTPVIEDPVIPVDPPTIPEPVIPEPPVIRIHVEPVLVEPPIVVYRPYIPVVPPPTDEVICVHIVIECPAGTPEVFPVVVDDSGQDSDGAAAPATEPLADFDDTFASEEVDASEDAVLADDDVDVLDEEMDELLM